MLVTTLLDRFFAGGSDRLARKPYIERWTAEAQATICTRLLRAGRPRDHEDFVGLLADVDTLRDELVDGLAAGERQLGDSLPGRAPGFAAIIRQELGLHAKAFSSIDEQTKSRIRARIPGQVRGDLREDPSVQRSLIALRLTSYLLLVAQALAAIQAGRQALRDFKASEWKEGARLPPLRVLKLTNKPAMALLRILSKEAPNKPREAYYRVLGALLLPSDKITRHRYAFQAFVAGLASVGKGRGQGKHESSLTLWGHPAVTAIRGVGLTDEAARELVRGLFEAFDIRGERGQPVSAESLRDRARRKRRHR